MINENLQDSAAYKQKIIENEPTIDELLALEKEMQSEEFLKNITLNDLSNLDESNKDIDLEETANTTYSDEDSDSEANLDIVKIYLDSISKHPLLDATEEVELAKRIETGDEEARQLLINSNLRLVVNLAAKYSKIYTLFGSVQLLDLIQDGNLGLMKAVDKYNYVVGCRFSTYAYWWIKQFILRGIQNNYSNVRLPVYINDQLRLVQRAREELNFVGLEDNKSLEQISDFINSHTEYRSYHIPKITPTIIKTYELLRANATTLSLSNPISPDEDNDRTVEDIIEAGTSYRPDFITEDKMQSEYLDKILEEVLDPKHALVIKLRYGLDSSRKPRSLEEVGYIIGVSRERIRQMEDNSLKKLKIYFLKLKRKKNISYEELFY